MADKFLEFEFEGEEEILLAMERVAERRRQRARDLVDDLADFAEYTMRANAPRDRGYLHRHIQRSPLRWRPGGAGGGGDWQATVGVKRGTSSHPFYVEFGTGLYGAVGWYIVPRTQAFMVWFSRRYGHIMYSSSTRGQRPQRYVYTTWRELQVYARGRLMAMDAMM